MLLSGGVSTEVEPCGGKMQCSAGRGQGSAKPHARRGAAAGVMGHVVSRMSMGMAEGGLHRLGGKQTMLRARARARMAELVCSS